MNKHIDRKIILNEVLRNDKEILKAEELFENNTNYLLKTFHEENLYVYHDRDYNYYIEEDIYNKCCYIHDSLWDIIQEIGFSREECRPILKHCVKKFINKDIKSVYTTVAHKLRGDERWIH